MVQVGAKASLSPIAASAAGTAVLYGCSSIQIEPSEEIKKYVNPSNSNGKEIPVVFLHGGGLNISSMASLFSFFNQRGHPVFGEDNLPGHGTKPYNGGAITMEELVEGHRDNLKKWGIDEHIVVGHSTGGMIALSHAIGHSRMYKGMVLANTLDVYPGEYKAGFGFLFKIYIATSVPNFRSQEPYDFSEQIDGKVIYSRSVRYTNPKAVEAIMDAVEKYDVRNHIGKIQCPMLFVRALDDIVIEPEGVELMAKRATHAHLIDVRGGQYWIMKKQPSVEGVVGPRYGFLMNK